jgi:hypothetical protein
MYEDHPVFKLICSEDSKVWRYMDFTKYLAMLQHGGLWFTRPDLLDDPFDSELPNSLIDQMKRNWQKALNERGLIYEKMGLDLERSIEGSRDWHRRMRRRCVVNCWHQNDHESAAMWKLYLKSDEGLAIVSTPRKLKEAVKEWPHFVFVGSIEYVDFGAYPPIKNGFEPYLRKRKSFQHEHELRAVAVKSKEGGITFEEFSESGILIPVDLSQLIDEVYVAPTCAPWFEELVRQLTTRFGLRGDLVKPSSLAEKPLWDPVANDPPSRLEPAPATRPA